MRANILARGCAATGWQINSTGTAGSVIVAAHVGGLLPWPALLVAGAGYAISAWWTGLAWIHDGWFRGWWWTDTDHQCPGDDGDDDPQPEPAPDEPHHHETYTLAA